jgi:putative membrane protein
LRYWYGDGGWHPWLVVLMWLGMVVFWGLVIFGVVWFVRGSRQSGPTVLQPPEPERILQERFARGEIDADEYRHRLDVLRGKVPPAPR